MKKILPKKRYWWAVLLMFFSLSTFAQTGKISGKISDSKGNPLVGVSVLIKNTQSGTSSDANGNYSIVASPANILQFSFVGFATQETKIGSKTTINISLTEDVSSLEEVVVTGVFDRRSALNSSIAISTLNTVQLEKITPVSAADLLKNVPGVYVNSSLGEVRNTVYSRGVATGNNDGTYGYDYVSMQEDGLPVTTTLYANFGPDFFLRSDATLSKVEAVRGGTASIVGTNSPGGIFNYISKTGGDKFEGEVRAKFGLEGNMKNPYYRADFNFGGPLANNLTYNIGGFYRQADGAQYPGYPSNYGGQLKANLLYKYNSGSLKFLVKYLNDHNLSAEALPATSYTNPTLVSGFDNTSSALIPSFQQTVNVPTLGNVTYDPAKLWHNTDAKFGINWEHKLGNDWKFTNNMAYSTKTSAGYSPEGTVTALDMTGLVTYIILGTVIPQEHGPPAAIATGNYNFSSGGKSLFSVNSVNVPLFPNAPPFLVLPIFNVTSNTSAGAGYAPNSLLFTPLIFQNNKATELFDQFNFNKKTKNMTFNIGGFYGNSSFERVLESFGVTINTFEPRPKPLVITLTDPTGKVYQITNSNGVAKVGADQGASTLSATQTQAALFFDHSWELNDKLTFNWGLRYESLGIKGSNGIYGSVPSAGGTDGNPLTIYDNASNALNATYSYDKTLSYLSYSAALNYKISANTAIYGRYSSGKKAPGFGLYGGVSTQFAQSTLDPQIQDIKQLEFGFKTRKENFSATITPFLSFLSHVPNGVTFTDNKTGLLYNPPALYNDFKTTGIELEASYAFSKNFSIRGVATIQDAVATTYKAWNHIDDPSGATNNDVVIDNSGNKLANTPNLMANITPEYATDKFYANFTWSYMGDRAANFANAWTMPAFSQVNLAAGYSLSPKLKLSANINNVFNNYGVMNWVGPGSFPFNLSLESLSKDAVNKNPNAFYETIGIPARAFFVQLAYKF